ncbi:MAG: 23S rRNA (guanosine(2251)-2'-O)-methyltransferase RlmB [Wolinella succinogenes]|nr:23S rRNA (guanosine(2251)-2'-O)-methyltransferase RlmB [Wolinella succinogenes]
MRSAIRIPAKNSPALELPLSHPELKSFMIIYGKQIFLYVLRRHPKLIKSVYLGKEVEKDLFKEISRLGIPLLRVDPKKAQAMARGGNHQGFLMEIEAISPLSLGEIKRVDRLLVLHGVSDSGNIGGIFRSAYCLGMEGVILTNLSSFSIESAIRTSSGALLELPFGIVKNPWDLINELRGAGFMLYGAALEGEIPNGKSFASKRALFMGSEGEGLPKKLLSKLDQLLKIEMERDFDSLNVGVAAAILMDRMRDGRSN